MRWFVLLLGVLCYPGCSSSDAKKSDESLNCNWLAGQNCWKGTVATVPSCAPPEGEVGVLSADGKSCTYASGYLVTFNVPVVLNPASTTGSSASSLNWDFSVSKSGQECMHVVTTDKSLAVTVGSDWASEQTNGLGMNVGCSDGTNVSTDNGLGLLSCTNSFSELPGYSWSDTTPSAWFSLTGTGDLAVPVFNCQLAQ